MRRTVWILLWLCSSFAVMAQEKVVTGTVKDEAGSPMPGVNILVKGTTTGTITDVNGDFKINAKESDVLLVTFVGYTTTEAAVGTQTNVAITLNPDVTSLNEVVVTGYSTERKQDLVSAVSTISPAATIAVPTSNIEQNIQGRVAGVLVQTTGQPGAVNQVRIRGYGSLTNNAPLYIVDGVPTFDVSNLSPYDIETTTILKDAGAASIYGSRAAAGVIVYTTKHGKNDGKTRIDFDMSSGVQAQGTGVAMLNPQQQADKVYEALRNSGAANANGQPYGPDLNHAVVPDYINVGVLNGSTWKPTGNIFEGDPRIATALANYNIDPSKGQIVQVVKANKTGTDWYKASTRNAAFNRFSLGMSGGTDRAHYYLSLSYLNQQGIVINQYIKRYVMRFNSEFKPIKQVRIGENMQLSYIDNPQIGGALTENQLNQIYRMPTIIPVHDVNGGYAGTAAPGFNNPANPVAQEERASRNFLSTTGTRIFGNAYVEVDPIQHLTVRSSFGGGLNYTYGFNYNQATYENAENTGNYTFSEGATYSTNWVFTNTARYENRIGDHNFKVLVGYEAVKPTAGGRSIFGSGLNPFSNDPNFISITNTNSIGRVVNSAPNQTSSLASEFARLDYNYKDRYYISGTVRRDGSSVFGVNSRYGTFPALSGAWRISTENFMQGVTFVQDLKLRGGYGIMGNQIIPPTNQYTLYNGGPGNSYDIGGTNNSVSPGLIASQYGNLSGQWERNATANIGLDASLLNGSLDITLEVWQKKTTKLLYSPNVLNSAGIFNVPYSNIASMQNKGIDLQIVKRIKVASDWNLTLDGNISPFQNKVTALVPGVTYFEPGSGNFRNIQFIRNAVGQPISSFFGYQQTGYFNTAEEVTNSPSQDGKALGRFRFKDQNGDNAITTDDRKFIGSAVPKFTYGLNVDLKYKNWSISALFYGKQGNKIVNFSKWYNGFYSSFSGAGLAKITEKSWTPALGNNASTPIIESASNLSTNASSNTWYVENGSYMRCKNLQLFYGVPAAFLSKYNVRACRLYLQATNLFTITKYTGKDPEAASSVDTVQGVDVGNYPVARIYSIGLNLGF